MCDRKSNQFCALIGIDLQRAIQEDYNRAGRILGEKVSVTPENAEQQKIFQKMVGQGKIVFERRRGQIHAFLTAQARDNIRALYQKA